MAFKQKISAIHHITAVASSAAENLAFYENILGLRLVKQTVNFDDPYTHHLYFGDAHGSPGTILTFFPWHNLPPGRPGAGMVTAVAFAVAGGAIDFWVDRLNADGIETTEQNRFGDRVVRFADPHGLPLELVGVDRPAPAVFWERGPVAAAHAIGGFHSATATLHRLDPKKALLTDDMGLTLHGREKNRYRFKLDNQQAPGHFYDILIEPQAPVGRSGGGTVHHIAFRTADDGDQAAWQSRLRRSGYTVTDVRDRQYFRSIYFHSPGSILFEIATDPPGFTVDETVEQLGSSLKLPRQHEPMRAAIERQLPPLRGEAFRHLFKEPATT